MELSIANLESNYLRETSGTGNIIKVGSQAVITTTWLPAADNVQMTDHPGIRELPETDSCSASAKESSGSQ